MPQPLSRVRPNAEIKIGDLDDVPLTRRPLAALAAMSVISTWSNVELHMLETYVNLAGGVEDTAAAMFLALETQSAKSAAINALAKTKLDEKKRRLLTAIQAVTKSSQGMRDKAAHWVWGDSPELPDAILLIDPRHLVKASLHVGNIIAASKRGDKIVVPEIDRSKVFVFSTTEFVEAAANNAKVASFWRMFESIIHGFTDEKGERYAWLCSRPEIADRLRRQGEPY